MRTIPAIIFIGFAVAAFLSCSDHSLEFPSEKEVIAKAGSSSSEESSSSSINWHSSSSSGESSSSEELSSSSEELSSSSEEPSSSSEACEIASSLPHRYFLDNPRGSFCDARDSRSYKYVAIYQQVWMAENLNYDANDSRCYDNNPANCEEYGRLYNSKMLDNICPDGWRLPKENEWEQLIRMDGENSDFLMAASGWNNCNGEDKFGFSAKPGGYIDGYTNILEGAGDTGIWWTGERKALLIECNKPPAFDLTYFYHLDKDFFSIRCLKNH